MTESGDERAAADTARTRRESPDAGAGAGVSGEKGAPRRRHRSVVVVTLYMVTITGAGVAVGAWGGGPHRAFLIGALCLLVTGLGAAVGVAQRRGAARDAGVPRASFAPLARRIQQEDIPDSPSERAAMRRLVLRQRRGLDRVWRYRWGYRLLAVFLVVFAVLRYLDGSPVIATLMLLGGVSQFCQPLLFSHALRRLDRVQARLGDDAGAAA